MTVARIFVAARKSRIARHDPIAGRRQLEVLTRMASGERHVGRRSGIPQLLGCERFDEVVDRRPGSASAFILSVARVPGDLADVPHAQAERDRTLS